jgi:Protein of unknown function (DUF3768)
MPNDQTTSRIRALNDALRTTLQGGRIMMTRGVSALGPARIGHLMERLRAFSQFDAENDPYGEHDFGAFDDEGRKYFWKIDYYDPSLTYHSEDASDPTKTVRVLTLMLAEEY